MPRQPILDGDGFRLVEPHRKVTTFTWCALCSALFCGSGKCVCCISNANDALCNFRGTIPRSFHNPQHQKGRGWFIIWLVKFLIHQQNNVSSYVVIQCVFQKSACVCLFSIGGWNGGGVVGVFHPPESCLVHWCCAGCDGEGLSFAAG